MNTDEIINELKDLYCFKGVYPIDKIRKLNFIDRPIAIVVNLDASDKPGSHWVAIFITSDNNALYFDSFGFPNFYKQILDFLENNNVKQLNYNKITLQSFDSSTCGAYCVLFIKMMCNKFPFSDFIKLFTNNKNSNDQLVSLILL